MAIVTVIGFGFAVAAAVVWAVTGWALTYWTYWWVLPEGARADVGPNQQLDTWGWAALLAAGGLVLLFVVPWICAALAQGEAQLARIVLGPTDRQRLQGRVEELSRTRAAAADAQAAELRRIERDLHDGAQARLVAMTMDLGLAQEKLESDPGAARELVGQAQAEARTAIVELRQLVAGIYPAVLADRGLDAALSGLAASSAVPVTLEVELPERVPPAVEAPPTSSSPRRSRTSPSIQARRGRRCASRCRTPPSSSRCPMTDEAAPTPRRGQGSGASPTASPRSTACFV